MKPENQPNSIDTDPTAGEPAVQHDTQMAGEAATPSYRHHMSGRRVRSFHLNQGSAMRPDATPEATETGTPAEPIIDLTGENPMVTPKETSPEHVAHLRVAQEDRRHLEASKTLRNETGVNVSWERQQEIAAEPDSIDALTIAKPSLFQAIEQPEESAAIIVPGAVDVDTTAKLFPKTEAPEEAPELPQEVEVAPPEAKVEPVEAEPELTLDELTAMKGFHGTASEELEVFLERQMDSLVSASDLEAPESLPKRAWQRVKSFFKRQKYEPAHLTEDDLSKVHNRRKLNRAASVGLAVGMLAASAFAGNKLLSQDGSAEREMATSPTTGEINVSTITEAPDAPVIVTSQVPQVEQAPSVQAQPEEAQAKATEVSSLGKKLTQSKAPTLWQAFAEAGLPESEIADKLSKAVAAANANGAQQIVWEGEGKKAYPVVIGPDGERDSSVAGVAVVIDEYFS